MFRKGGSAGGITSGLRQGYATGGGDLEADPGTEINPEIVATKSVVEEAPPATPYAYERIDPPEAPGFDWGSFGLNLMSGPSRGDIFSDIGEAGKEPYSRYRQGRAAYDMNKYQSKLAERQFGLEVYKAMNDDDKLEVQRKMKFYMDQGMTEEEAFNAVIYRKPMHPKEQARIKSEEEAAAYNEQILRIQGDLAKEAGESIPPHWAENVYKFYEWAKQNSDKYNIDNTQPYIDFAAGTFEKSDDGNYALGEDVVDDFKEGFAYVNPNTGEIYYKSGASLVLIRDDDQEIKS
jgi:hypothetical protein